MKDLSGKAWEYTCAVALSLGGELEVNHLGNAEKSDTADQPIKLRLPCSGAGRKYADLRAHWKQLPFQPTELIMSKTPPEVHLAMAESRNAKFAVCDAVIYRDVCFKHTISKGEKKLPTWETVVELLKDVGATPQQPLHLYHYVPPQQFTKCCAAPTPKGTASRDDMQFVQARLLQYVLQIPAALPLPLPKREEASSAAS